MGAFCCVKGCRNGQGYLMKRFPKNPKLRKLWMERVIPKGRSIPICAKVCEAHFEPCMFEKVRVDGKRKLKESAIPTLFSYYQNLPSIPPTLDRFSIVESVMKQNNLVLSSAVVESDSKGDVVIEFDVPDDASHMQNSVIENWSYETVESALKLKFIYRDGGYQELVKEVVLPPLDMLKTYVQRLPFTSGVLNKTFDYLKIKVSGFANEFYKDCTVHFEEVSILKTSVYNIGHKKCFGTVSKALVVTLCGVFARWSQTVAYFFTGGSVTGLEYNNILLEILDKTKKVGLKVIAVTCKLGESQQRFLEYIKICADRRVKYINNYIVHKTDSSKTYVVPDVSQSFKNFQNSFVSNKTVTILSCLQELYCLPTACARFDHIEQLRKHNIRLVPTATQEGLLSAPFKLEPLSEAKVYDISSGLKALAEETHRSEYNTTAWLIDMMEKWFLILTSKHPVLALNKLTPEAHEETVQFLKDFIELVSQMQIGDDDLWHHCQSNIILATQSILDIQDLLLHESDHNFLMTSGITESCIAKLLSSEPALSAAKFTRRLRKICEVQFWQDISRFELSELTAEPQLNDIKTEEVEVEEIKCDE